MTVRHLLGLSGGRDSAALAVFMSQNYPELDIEYFFTDTGEELPEVYDYLGQLEGFLGKEIVRLNAERDFKFWLDEYGNLLPSPRSRWCTRQLKLKPFQKWIEADLKAGKIINSYVAIRSDESDRLGMHASDPNLKVSFPFKEHSVDRQGVIDLLEGSGLGMPAYYSWRSRSGCTFCFYQQKIEWVGLMREHPEAFERAKAMEKTALEHDSPFTWSEGESLEELCQEDRVKQIEEDYEARRKRELANRAKNPLREGLADLDVDEVYGVSDIASSCVICHK